MPRKTNNSSQSGRSIQTARSTSQSRRRNAPKHVSFENEQGNAVAVAAAIAIDRARQKKEQEKAKMAQIQAENAAVRNALQVQQQEEALRVARLEEQIETLQRDKDLEIERLRRISHRPQEDSIVTEPFNEFDEFAEVPSPNTVRAKKREEETRNGPYEYSLRAVLKAKNGSVTVTK